jgi:hypothetical protein
MDFAGRMASDRRQAALALFITLVGGLVLHAAASVSL